jgi:hypothetical protein
MRQKRDTRPSWNHLFVSHIFIFMCHKIIKRLEENMTRRSRNARQWTDDEKTFVSDLRELMLRHGVSISAFDQYDGADSFAGREYTFEKWEHGAERAAVHLDLRDVEDMLP